MDFSFTDEQREVAALTRQILSEKVDPGRLAALESSGKPRFDEFLWRQFAASDLLGVGLPPEAGGSGGDLLAQALILQEVGRTLAPLPYLTTIVAGASTIARFGTRTCRESWLPAVIGGDVVIGTALAEPQNHEPYRPRTTATPDGAGWRLNGVKTAVPAAAIAGLFLVPASAAGRGAVFLVAADAPGVTVIPQETATHEPIGQLHLDNVLVTDVLGDDPDLRFEALRYLRERMTVGLCAVQLGVLEYALQATARYTTEREQFGRPIATFQAVGHRAADAYIDVEGVRLTLWQAIYRLEAGLPAEVEVHTVKWWAAEAGHRVAHAAVHLHGGMGIATEHSLHRYFAHAKQNEFSLGCATEQALRIGEHLAAEPV
jgi:3-oxocholest-4-en-26-oyl-CoA dehydrogenase beta subunit